MKRTIQPAKAAPAWPPKPPQASFPPGVPCLLYSYVEQVTLLGGDRLPVMADLACPYDGPMVLDEIRFNVSAYSASTAAFPMPELEVKLTLDGKEITNGFVAVWALSSVYDFMGSEYNVDSQNYIITPSDTQIWACRFVLPAPLFLKPGQAVVATFRRKYSGWFDQNDSSYVMRVDVSYAGRLLPAGTPPPPTIALPYVTGIAANNNSSTTPSSTTLIAAEDVFRNKFDKPLYVSRFCGRRLVANYSSGVQEWGSGGFETSTGINTGPRVRIIGPDGIDCVRGYQDFHTVFGGNRRCWNVGTWLPPDKAFSMSFQSCHYVTVNMIGYREEAI